MLHSSCRGLHGDKVDSSGKVLLEYLSTHRLKSCTSLFPLFSPQITHALLHLGTTTCTPDDATCYGTWHCAVCYCSIMLMSPLQFQLKGWRGHLQGNNSINEMLITMLQRRNIIMHIKSSATQHHGNSGKRNNISNVLGYYYMWR